MKHEIVPVRTYILVWMVLIILTFTTWGVATIDLGEFNIVVAITIAVIKMLLVVIIFMHVKQDDSQTRLFVGAGFLWLLIMLALTLNDYLSRSWIPSFKPY